MDKAVISMTQTHLPKGRPYLLENSGTLELIYLSWGSRRYGDMPIPVSLHEGWVCSLILSGAPHLTFANNRSMRVSKHHMVIVPPQTASGWNDRPGRICHQLTWLWRRPILSRPLSTSRRNHLVIPLDPDSIERLKQIHQCCRNEIAASDELTARSLTALRESLEIELERNLAGFGRIKSSDRFAFAIAWLERHGHEERPLSRLAEYLQVSLSTLNRLFRKKTGISAADWLHQQKMHLAASLLESGNLNKKQIAYKLGYRHPNDFSRAWSRWQAKKPSAVSRQMTP